MSIQDTNPSVFFGGIWERIAKGKTLIGVDENDIDFNISSKTGGEKEHTLTINEMPKHNHDIMTRANWSSVTNTTGALARSTTNSGNEELKDGSIFGARATGGSLPHNNMQPYYTCYIFVRTA